MGRIIVGMDQSLTSTGLATLDTESSFHRTAAVHPKTTGVRRLLDIEAAVRSWLVDAPEPPCIVVMEGYSMAARGRAVFALGELGGVLRVALARAGFTEEGGTLLVVPPTTLKKFTTGKGTADKSVMRLAAYKKWGMEAATDDEVDAYALARFGEQQLAQGLLQLPSSSRKEMVKDA